MLRDGTTQPHRRWYAIIGAADGTAIRAVGAGAAVRETGAGTAWLGDARAS